MSRSQVQVDLNYLQSLEDDSRKLKRLEAAGVDSWDGYDYAMGGVDGEEEDDDE